MNFSKWRGLYSDFIIIESERNIDNSSLAKAICNRFSGVGARKLICLNATKKGYIITAYESGGGACPPCGEAMRSAALYIYKKTGDSDVVLLSGDNAHTTHVLGGICAKSYVPFDAEVKVYHLKLSVGEISLYEVLCAGKYPVVFVQDIKNAAKLTAEIKEILNINKGRFIFCEAISRRLVRLKTDMEDENTNIDYIAMAVFKAGIKAGLMDNYSSIMFDKGELQLQQEAEKIYITAPATSVFKGNYNFLSNT